MTAPQPTVRLLVCGAADRGDDGAALAAVAHLLPALPDDLRSTISIQRCGQLGPMDLVPPSGRCEAIPVVLDTVVGVEPGTVVTLPLSMLGSTAAPPVADVSAGRTPAAGISADGPSVSAASPTCGSPAPRSTRTLPPDAVVRLAEVIAERPLEGTFIGIGGRWFGYGQRFSRAVKAGLPAFEAAILFELERLRANTTATP